MSLIRIVLGVIVGGCIVAGLLAAAVRFPAVAGFIMFGAAGGGLLAVAYHGLRTGVIGARRSKYERGVNSFGYWFYISFYAFLGLLIFGFAFCSLFYPQYVGK
jgi:hypothetical protein